MATQPICVVPDCGKPEAGHFLCSEHLSWAQLAVGTGRVTWEQVDEVGTKLAGRDPLDLN